MSDATGDLFGIHTRAMALWQRRAEVLAGNLANADTPHYLARDIDFRSVLGNASAQSGMALATTSSAHQTGNAANDDVPLLYRTSNQPTLDGNSVDAQTEQVAFAENSVRYQASLTFINAQIRMLRTAIVGS